MNLRTLVLSAAVLLSGALLMPTAAHASLALSTRLQSIAQMGDGSSAVSLGHTVMASTNLNRLIANKTFNSSCASTVTDSIPGERTLPSESFVGGNSLYVTIPAQLPAYLNMPGFENVTGGTILSCTYAWTSRAQEATYTVGVPGFGITIGGQELRDGGSVGFYMYKTADDGDPGHGCLR